MKNILLTGASSGVGLAVTKMLLNEGYQVTGISRKQPPITHDHFTWLPLDLAKPANVKYECKHSIVPAKFDGLIYCAGVGHFGGLEQLSVENFIPDMQVNCFSAMIITKALMPSMKKNQAGQFIFIGSEAALKGAKQSALYCATKFALRGFVQSLAEEMRRYQIPVTLINPGLLRTHFHDKVHFEPAEQSETVIDLAMIVNAVKFLITNKNHGFAAEIELKPYHNQIKFKT